VQSDIRVVIVERGAGTGRCPSDCIMLAPGTYELPYDPQHTTNVFV